MKIVNVGNEKINACFQFCSGNCLISVSTIFKKNIAEIAVFDKHSNELLEDGFLSIDSALNWVGNFGPRD